MPHYSIRLSRAVYDEIRAHAVETYPYECCGYITGTDDPATWTVHRCRNIQNELHARAPEQYPRDARDGYTFSKEDMERLFFGDFGDPDARVVGFYHSHPDSRAYFSDEDRKNALVEFLQPEPFYLVASVIDGTVRDIKAFSWVETRQTFQTHGVEIED